MSLSVAVSGVHRSVQAMSQPQGVSVAAALAAASNSPAGGNYRISDSAANISASFDALTRLGSQVKSIALTSGSAPITLTAGQYSRGGSVINSISGTYSLNVTGVSADAVAGIASNKRVATINVSDTSSNLSNNMSTLLRNAARLGSIDQVGTRSAMTMTASDYASHPSLVNAFSGQKTFALTNATAAAARTLASNAAVASVAVKDTSANISTRFSDITAIAAGKLATVQASDPAAIRLSYADYQANTGTTLTKLVGGSTISVSDVAAADAVTVAGDANVTSLTVRDTAANLWGNRVALGANSKVISATASDTAANIASSLDNLQQLGSRLNAVQVSDLGSTLSISATSYAADASTLAKIGGGYRLQVTGASAGGVAALLRNSHVQGITVTDTVGHAATSLGALSNAKVTRIDLAGSSADIQSRLADLVGLKTSLVSITNTTVGSAISLTAAQYTQSTTTLAKVDSLTIDVTGVAASMAKGIATNASASVHSVSVTDSAANVARYFDDLSAIGAGLRGISLSDPARNVALSAAQYATGAAAGGVLSKFTTPTGQATTPGVAVSGVLAADAANIAAGAGVNLVSVSDSSANIEAHLQDLVGLGQDLNSVTQTGTPSAIAIDYGDLGASSGVLGKIQGNYTLAVSNLSTSQAASLVASNSHVASVTIGDSGANISTALGAGTYGSIGLSKISGIQQADASVLEVDASSLAAQAATLAKVTTASGNPYGLSVRNAAAGVAASLVSGNTHVQAITVQDSASAVMANLTALNGLAANGGKLTAISLNDQTSTLLSLSAGQYANNSAALGLMADPSNDKYSLSVGGVSVSDAIDASKDINTDAHVAHISVADTTANINAALDTLAAMPGDKLLNITSSDPDAHLTLTGTQYSTDGSALAKLNGGTWLADVSDVSAATAVAVGADANVVTFTVSDTAQNLAANLNGLGPLASSAVAGTAGLQSVTQTDGDPIAMTAAQYGDAGVTALRALLPNASFNVTDVAAADVAGLLQDAQIASASVGDTGANLATSLDDLQANQAKIDRIVQSDVGTAITITGDQYANDVDAIGKIQGDYRLVIGDASGALAGGIAADGVAAATSDVHVQTLNVADTSANLSTRFHDLVAANAAGKLGIVEETDYASGAAITLPRSELRDDVDTLMKVVTDDGQTPGFNLNAT